MEMTVCDTLGWYGECINGDSTANKAAILLDCPSAMQVKKTGILQSARWALRLDGEVAELRDDQEFWDSIVERVSSEQLTSIMIVGQTRNATAHSAELFQAGLDKHLPAYVQVSVAARFYDEDLSTATLHGSADGASNEAR